MSAHETDELASKYWRIMQPMLFEIEPGHSAILGLLEVHAGAAPRVVMVGKEMVVPADYRYHRYFMPKSLIKDETFKGMDGNLKAQPLGYLGLYCASEHEHTAITRCFKQPPGAL